MSWVSGMLDSVAVFVQNSPAIVQALESEAGPIIEIIEKIAPEVVSKAEEIAMDLFKNVDMTKAVEFVLTKLFAPHKMTREEEERWFQQATGDEGTTA